MINSHAIWLTECLIFISNSSRTFGCVLQSIAPVSYSTWVTVLPGPALQKESPVLGLLLWRVFFYLSAGIGEERVTAVLPVRGNTLCQLLEISVVF